MCNIEYSYLVAELKPLIGRHFSKFRQIGNDCFILGISGMMIAIMPGVFIHPTKYLEKGEDGSPFVSAVRAELKGTRLTDLYQYENDRVIVFQFGPVALIFEQFAKGNAILVKDGKTVASFREEEWADRVIKKGERYDFPKSNLKSSLREAISEKYIISALLQLPLGKEYAKEILSRCGIPEKKAGTALGEEEIAALEREIATVISSLQPRIFFKNEKIADYGLISFSQYESEKKFSSFGEVLDSYYWEVKSGIEDERVARLKRKLAQQRKHLAELKKSEEVAKACGDYIYSNYKKVEEILELARSTPLDKIEEKLKPYNARVDKKRKELEVDI